MRADNSTSTAPETSTPQGPHLKFLRLRLLCGEIRDRVNEPMKDYAYPNISAIIAEVNEVVEEIGWPAVPIHWQRLDAGDIQAFWNVIPQPAPQEMVHQEVPPRRLPANNAPPRNPSKRPDAWSPSKNFQQNNKFAESIATTLIESANVLLVLTDPRDGSSTRVRACWLDHPVIVGGCELKLPKSQKQQREKTAVYMDRWVRYLDEMFTLAEAHAAVAEDEPSQLEETSGNAGNISKARIKKEVAYPLIQDHLIRRPHDTVKEVANAVRCSTGLVGESPAWKQNQKRLRQAKRERRDPSAIPLNANVINDAGGRRFTQQHAHDQNEAALDEELDLKPVQPPPKMSRD